MILCILLMLAIGVLMNIALFTLATKIIHLTRLRVRAFWKEEKGPSIIWISCLSTVAFFLLVFDVVYHFVLILMIVV